MGWGIVVLVIVIGFVLLSCVIRDLWFAPTGVQPTTPPLPHPPRPIRPSRVILRPEDI